MKLKLLFFMGVLSVLCNTMYGQNTPPRFVVPPADRTECPKYTAANIEFRVTDDNTPAPLLTTTGLKTGGGSQTVDLVFRSDPTGLLRAVDVIPTAPFVGGPVIITISLTDVAPPAGPITVTTVFTVNFDDSTPPTFDTGVPITNRDVNISSSACQFTVPDYTNLVTASDFCGNVTLTQLPLAGDVLSVAHNGTQTITIRATDEYLQFTETTFQITFKDVTKPTISSVADKTVLINTADCNFTIPDYRSETTTSDNCGTVTVTQSPIGTTLSGDGTQQTITLTANDGNGNTQDTTFVITLDDKTKPVFTSTPAASFNESVGADCKLTLPTYAATATDNCGAPTITQSPIAGTELSGHNTTQVVTLTAADGNGNTETYSFTITLKDVTLPSLTAVAGFDVNLDSSCTFTIPDYTSRTTATDNCGTPTVTQSPLGTTISGHNTPAVITLTATDAAGNVNTTTFTITAKDVTKPTITGIANIERDNDAGICTATVSVSATASDNCTSPITASGTRSDLLALGAPYPLGVTTITWVATDGATNQTTETQTVTVNDVEDPVLTSPMVNGFNSLITVDNDPGQCFYTTAQLLSIIGIAPTATDNCPAALLDITVSPTTVQVSPGPDHPTELITWTVTDSNGNTATATQEILVRDLVLPIMRTKDISRSFDANGQVIITADDIDDGSTDNSGTACFDRYVVDNIIDCSEVGVHDVVLFGKDRWGNQHYSIAKVTTTDDTDPTFVEAALPVIDLNTNTGCTWVGILPIPATADNCSVVSVTNDAPAEFPVGDTTVTWTVADAAGNDTTITQLVSVVDAEKPVAIARVGVIVTLDTAGNATILPEEIDNGSSDNCTIDSIVVTPDTFSCVNIGTNVVTLTVTDVNGNVSTIDTVVTVIDNLAPVVVTKDIDLQLNALGTASIVAADVIDSSSDNCASPITSVVYPSSFTCANVGTNTVTVTLTDNYNNVITATAIVTVKDEVKPVVITKNIVVQLDSAGAASIVAADVNNGSSDACGIDTMTVSPNTFTCASIVSSPITVTLTVKDKNGNVETGTATVTVEDKIAPIAKAKAITVQLDATGSVTLTTAQVNDGSSDNCTALPTLTLSKTIFTCDDLGLSTVTLTATDAAGNVSLPVNVEVTVQDTTAPVVNTKDITVSLDASGNVSIVPSQINNVSTDNCTIASYSLDKTTFNCSNVGTNTVTLTVIDSEGNSATKTAVVTVKDDIAPIVSTSNIVIQLNSAGNASIIVSDINNGSTDNCGIKTYTLSKSSFDCTNVGDNTITLTAEDNAGNTASATAIVTVQDKVIPTATTKPYTAQLGATGTVTITAADVNNGSSDICGAVTLAISKATFTCANVGDNVITLTVTDVNGNSNTAFATVTVKDEVKPVVNTKNITVQLDNEGKVSIVAADVNNISTDACGISTMTVSKTSFDCANVGANTVTLTVTDVNGNFDSKTAVVTVVDSVKPIAIGKPITISLNGTSGSVSITAADVNNSSSDVCGIKSLSVSPNSFTCSNVGVNMVTLTVTDNNDNVSTTLVPVTVLDTTLPVLVTKAFTATLSSTGKVSITPADVITTATDICGIKSTVVEPFEFTCANRGLNTVIVTVTDANDNVITGTAVVTVQDITNPTITVTNLIVDTNAGCIWTGSLGTPVTADNCSVVSVTNNRAADFNYPVGDTAVLWTVRDAAGNSATATQTITVRDLEKPIAKATDFTVFLNAAGTATITVAQVNNGSSDNCSILTVLISKSTFNCTNVGQNTVVLTVTDVNGNIATANSIVTVVDEILPVIAPVTNIAVNTSAGICGANLAVTPSATASDNCTVGTPIGTRSDARALSATYPLGRTTITWNVTDANGNEALPVIQTVDITDAQIPVITSNGNKTADADVEECTAIVAVSATATDNCSVGSPMGVRSDAKPLASPFPVGTTTITWNVTDVNGNAAVAVIQTVTVSDKQRPVITANGNKFTTSDAGQCGAIVAVSATATDNCSVTNAVIGTRSDAAAINVLYPVGTTTITWNVTDVNGNAAIPVVQTVIVKDLQIPVINGTVATINASTDATVCQATVAITAPTASDNCTVGLPVGTRSDNLALTALYPLGTTTITWRVSDVNGNAAIPTTTTVIVKDMVKPTVITQNIAVQLNVGGFVTIVPAQINNGSTDACGIASYSLDKISFNCSNIGANTVTLTVIDIHGNVNTATATVTVSEPIIPIARTRNIIVQLNAAGTVSILPSDINNGSTDNCSIASYELSKSTFNCTNVGQNIITLTAIDASGNRSVAVNATVTVEDKVAPVITAVVNIDKTTTLNQCGWTPILAEVPFATAVDNCTVTTPNGTRSDGNVLNALYPIGTTIITWKVTDNNGNVGIPTTTTVNVKDITGPSVTINYPSGQTSFPLVLNRDSVTIEVDDILFTATDACGVDVHSYSLSRDTFTIVDVLAGTVIINLTVKDIYGNPTVTPVTITFPVVPTNAVEAVTPNGDGLNDTWVIENITNHPKSVVRVYNRWGSMVFSALNYQNNWDGRLNGSDATLPDGQAYYYQVDLKGNGTIDKEGWLYIKK